MVTTGNIEFDEWLAELDEEELRRYPDSKYGSFTGQTGAECWRVYFEEGMSPAEALDADNEYG